jgi:hypothetical protein
VAGVAASVGAAVIAIMPEQITFEPINASLGCIRDLDAGGLRVRQWNENGGMKARHIAHQFLEPFSVGMLRLWIATK